MLKKALLLAVVMFIFWSAVLLYIYPPFGWLYIGASLATFPFWVVHNYLVFTLMDNQGHGFFYACNFATRIEIAFIETMFEVARNTLREMS